MFEKLDDFQLDKNTVLRLLAFEEDVKAFRQQGPLDPIAAKKLQEYFRVQHIFHSTGIEGNRLSIRETEMVLLEGMQIGDKPLVDQLEVKDLDAAFSYLTELSHSGEHQIREIDMRELHRLVVGNKKDAFPGEYRRVGVVITGSEHRPPEPIAVPGLVKGLVQWLESSSELEPVLRAAYVHHQVTAIHPFADGNGRLSRLIMNLVFLREGFPVVNIRRSERAKYYESLSFADAGIYDPLVELIIDRAADVFIEMKRVREESDRMKMFAEHWGQTEAAVIQRREEREYRHWLGQMELVRLAFENAADLLDEKLQSIRVEFWRYPDPDFAKFIELREKGKTPQSWFFRLRLRDATSGIEENFVFNFFRSNIYGRRRIIPLVANRENELGTYTSIDTPKIRLRDAFVDEKKVLNVRVQHSPDAYTFSTKISPEQAVQEFFEDVLKSWFGLAVY